MGLFNTRATRKEVAEKICKCHNSENYVNDFIKVVEEFIAKHKFKSDSEYILCGRKKLLYNEFYDCLDRKKWLDEDPIAFAVGDLKEFICLECNFISAQDVDKSKWQDGKIILGSDVAELRKKVDSYYIKGYICLEEKEYIVKMLDRLKKEYYKRMEGETYEC